MVSLNLTHDKKVLFYIRSVIQQIYAAVDFKKQSLKRLCIIYNVFYKKSIIFLLFYLIGVFVFKIIMKNDNQNQNLHNAPVKSLAIPENKIIVQHPFLLNQQFKT